LTHLGVRLWVSSVRRRTLAPRRRVLPSLKEISYIHAEAYAAAELKHGPLALAAELKHGPLALVDEGMPVVAVAPNNDLLEKLKSNLQEVRARGGNLVVFADPDTGMESTEGGRSHAREGHRPAGPRDLCGVRDADRALSRNRSSSLSAMPFAGHIYQLNIK
jgi:hypothetical protein